ncbi:hypothetical protein F5X68DRAFT_263908 [Plectosphaerella plurivora]|uniref:Zn(2)-C6 fungal-type domain-containing protein n=1 Tax=Plectosphaerella plurivora TaxID=936078 RepID=A0A9P8V729_9PEZI|nr:hypothetical protein F5X68DRAFT_263908 [Plectosphaerella plurivora]
MQHTIMDGYQVDLESTTHRPFHTKRPHKKSRAGCLNCKKRKVKCNEARPVCNNCTLRNVDCVYPDAKGAAGFLASRSGTTLGSTSRAGSVSRTQVVSSSSSPQSEGFDVTVTVVREPLFIPAPVRDTTDLKLMWYYTTNTFASFLTVRNAREQRIDDILKITIPAFAFEHPFLMDTLLSLSAIQLQLDPAPGQAIDVEPARIYHYRARAFEGYRRAVEEARPETYPALMACSLLLIGLASQTFREPDSKDLFVLDWMVLWRGIGIVFELIKAKGLLQSGIAELFCRPPIDLDQAALHIPNSLLFMVSSTIASSASALSTPGDYMQAGLDEYDLENDAESASSRDTYYAALRYLGSLYRELRNGFGPRLNLRAITWFTYLPRHFIQLATARRPRALLIIAHYLMFLKLVRGTWWVDGITDREIPSIARLFLGLDRRIRDWSAPYMAAPLAVVRVSSPTEIARIILGDPAWIPPPTPPDQQQLLEPPPMLSSDANAEVYTGPFMVDNNGKLTKYDSVSGSFVAIEPEHPQTECSPSSSGLQQGSSDGISSPSPSSETTSTMVNGSGADLEDVQMDKLHLDTALRYGSLDIVLGNLRDEPSQDPWPK